MNTIVKGLLFSLALLVLAACGSTENKKNNENVVNVYTHRHYDSDKELFSKFTQLTGIEVNVLKATADELMVRIQQEGERSPADLLFTVDAGNLEKAKSLNLFQAIESELLFANIPQHLRDEENFWFAQTMRARVIIAAKDFEQKEELRNYEDLADPKFKDQVVMRSSSNVYNQSLMASLVAHNGEDAALLWAEGVVGNMARAPKGGDRDQVKDIASGKGKISLVNTYYLGQMLFTGSAEEVEAVKAVQVIFPNQEGRGIHINVSGAGVAKHAPNKENAIKLLEFLSEQEAQQILATSNFEYPVNPAVEEVSSGYSLKGISIDTLSVSVLGKNNAVAVTLFDKAGWK